VVAEALAVSLDKPLEWAVGFFFGNVELNYDGSRPEIDRTGGKEIMPTATLNAIVPLYG